jgi:predicted RND superfamily exporter protein
VKGMERKRLYRLLLPVVIILATLYTLGIMGVLPFAISYYITIFMIFLFIFLRWEARMRRN